MAAFLSILFSVVFGKDRARLFGVSSLVLGIFLVFNALYFLNVIPPVPLSLKDIGIYHSLLARGDGGYAAIYEQAPWWQFWRDTSAIYTLGVGQSAFCFSSVFAPTGLDAPIIHAWERYDQVAGQWIEVARVSFPISGGSSTGYRGYSVKSNLAPGAWRCNVETERGALIGRIDFTAVESPSSPALSQTVL